MIPSCDQTGTPLHFPSSTTSGSACLMRARTWESVLPLQSFSSLILASISREGDSPLVVALFFICTSLCRQTSVCPRHDLLQVGKEPLPPVFGALVGLLLIRPEARLLHAQ